MSKLVKINQELSCDSKDYWVGTVNINPPVPFYVTPDEIMIDGLKYLWPENIEGSIEKAVLGCLPDELKPKIPKQVKLQYVITEGYDILLNESAVETFKQRLENNELTIMDTKEAKQTSYEHWCNEY